MHVVRDPCGCPFDADSRTWITDCPRHHSQAQLERLRLEIISRQINESRMRSMSLFSTTRGPIDDEKTPHR